MEIIILTPDKKKTKIKVNPKMTIGEAKELFYKICGNRNNNQWKFMADVLKDGKTLECYEIEDNDKIEANPASKGGGPPSFGIETIDISKNISKVLKFVKNAPFYRTVSFGLNIQGICSNRKCKANNDVVWMPKYFVWDYELLHNLNDIKCPACDKMG